MSIALSQVLQRVRVRGTDSCRTLRVLPERVHAVLRVICDSVFDQEPERPVVLFVKEIARRCCKKVRTVQTALREAEALGLIKRIRIDAGRSGYGDASERQMAATWPILVNPVLIAASTKSTPYKGADLVSPLRWEKGVSSRANESSQASTRKLAGANFAAAKIAGEMEAGKDHTPPRSGKAVSETRKKVKRVATVCSKTDARSERAAEQVEDRLDFPTGACARGECGNRTRRLVHGELPSEPEIQEISLNDGVGDDFDPSPTAQRESRAHLEAWRAASDARLAAKVAMVASATSCESVVSDSARYWSWLKSGASVAGWIGRTDGLWPGAKAGDFEFMAHRRLRTGGRGGIVKDSVLRVGLSAVDEALSDILRFAGRRQAGERASGKWSQIEVILKPTGEHALLLIDDLKAAAFAQFDGWSGVAILETSPGNYQASLMSPRVLKGDETVLVQKALAVRCGLTFAATQACHIRRGPGSVNNKPELATPFVTRLQSDPIPGTISHAQLAELLAEGRAYSQDASTNEGGGHPDREIVKRPKGKRAGPTKAVDDTASGVEWAWVMREVETWGCDKEQLKLELEQRAGERQRGGRPAGHQSHMDYANLTVENAVKKRDVRRERDRSKSAATA